MCRDRDEEEASGSWPDWAPIHLWNPIRRLEVARPEDTDNAQCWSEEIFSLLEDGR